MMTITTRNVASIASIMGQSLRYASTLPRDSRNWQIEKYAPIKMNATGKPAPAPTNDRKNPRSPRQKASNCFDILSSWSHSVDAYRNVS